MTTHPDLKWQLDEHLSEELATLENALVIPLGPKVEEGLNYLAKKGSISQERILAGIPHPSGANAERISFFLDKKHRSKLSNKTNPEKLLQARKSLIDKVARLSI
jgi:hypothetical protein